MHKIFLWSLIIFILFLCWLQPFNIEKKEVLIPKNLNASEVAQILSKNHIIRSTPEFMLWLKILGKEHSLRFGRYEFFIYKNPIYVIQKLTQGGRSDIQITIPEGLTITETAEILHRHNLVNKKSFIKLCNDRDFIKKIGFNFASLEGCLFPDTYSFDEAQGDTQIILKMVRNFKKQISNIVSLSDDSLYKILILASLVEKEARYDEERPVIARVFLNRLKLNRPLESCASVIYALKIENPGLNITYLRERDLKFNSLYNTYQYQGLPPGPICSPGINSIKSVLNPADVDYLYFVARGDGYHHFSRTYQEHLKAKEYYNAQR